MESNTENREVIKRVKLQLTEFYNGDNWVTDNFKEKVLSLKEEDTLIKLPGFSHTITELVGHIIAWRNFAVQKLTGNDDYDIEDNSEEDWSSRHDWKTLCKEFEICHQKLSTAIDNFPVDKWNEKVPGRSYSFIYLICGIINHDYYHYGQIGAMLAAIKKI